MIAFQHGIDTIYCDFSDFTSHVYYTINSLNACRASVIRVTFASISKEMTQLQARKQFVILKPRQKVGVRSVLIAD